MTIPKLRLESVCLQGIKRWCEDALFCNEETGVYGVLDGATSVTPWTDERGRTGSYLAAQLFADFFRSREPVPDLCQRVLDANAALRRAMEATGIDMADKPGLWCTCVAAVQMKEREMSYVQLGDSMVAVIMRDGTIRVLTRDTVFGISHRAYLHRAELRAQGVKIREEDYASREAQLRYNRTLANLPNGYSVANGMPQVADTIQFGHISLEDVACVLMMTDGLFWAAQERRAVKSDSLGGQAGDGRCDWNKVADLVRTQGLIGYVNALIEWEQRWGRVPDDKAGIALWCEEG